MKIIVAHKNLKKALSLTEKVVTKNTTLPILGNILLKTENGRLKISATNLEIGINYFIGAKIEETGEVAVPARIFSEFIHTIQEDKLNLVAKSNILHVGTAHYKTQILGFSAQDFPIIPKIKAEKPLILSPRIIKSGLAAVFDSVSLSESRPELAGVYLHTKDGNLVFAATDSFRLAEKKSFIGAKQPTISIILPRNTTGELMRICGEIEEDVNLYTQDNQIALISPDLEFVSRLVDGTYPDYSRVIPERVQSKVVLKKDEAEKSIRLAGLFSSHVSDIKFVVSKEGTQITAKNSDKGEIEETIESMLQGSPFEINLNFHYFLDGLKIINTPQIVVEFTGAGSPLVLRPHEDKSDTLYLIMPLRNPS